MHLLHNALDQRLVAVERYLAPKEETRKDRHARGHPRLEALPIDAKLVHLDLS
jgi:hypothetical protein